MEPGSAPLLSSLLALLWLEGSAHALLWATDIVTKGKGEENTLNLPECA
jgi:hypothetical protein